MNEISGPGAGAAAADSAGWLPPEFEPGLVSVVIPVFNRARLVLETLDTVAAQTWRPIELVVVDDGSTDNTSQAVQAWIGQKAPKDGFRAKLVRQEKRGAPAARNRGARESSGEFVQFFDSDDWMHPDRLAAVAGVFAETACDYVYTGFSGFCGECKETVDRYIPEPRGDPLVLLCFGRFWGNTLQFCWRRALLGRIGPWNESLIVYQDYEYIARALLQSRNGRPLCRILAHARRSGPARLDDIRSTRAGHICFFAGAERLALGLARRKDIPQAAKTAFEASLLRRGVTLAREHPDLARRCFALARHAGRGGPLFGNFSLRMARLLGRPGCMLYETLFRLRKGRGPLDRPAAAHRCPAR